MVFLKDFAQKLESRNRGAFLGLGELSDSHLFNRYRIASRMYYDPYAVVPWDAVRLEDYGEEERIALRYYWSRVALFEQQLAAFLARAMEAAMVGPFSRDIKQLIMMQLRDEWYHTEMPGEYARRLGGILPPSSYVEEQLRQRHSTRIEVLGKLGLHNVFVQFCFGELCWASSHIGPSREVKDPAARAIFNYYYTDENRHARSNWTWSIRALTEESRRIIERLVGLHYKNVYGWLNMGYLELPADEREFHLECVKIAKDLGHARWNADEYMKQYKTGLKAANKLMDESGLSIDPEILAGV